jgi:hypothetical protein
MVSHLRTELQIYSTVCETLLSPVLQSELTDEERDRIVYYAKELLNKFNQANLQN